MRTTIFPVLAISILALSSPGDEMETLRSEIDDLTEKVEQLQQSSQQQKKTSWTDKVTVKGKVFSRYEHVEIDHISTQSRFLGHARLGVYADVSEHVYAGLGLGTGADQRPTSVNQNLSDFASKYEIWLDLMYMGFRPKGIQGLDITMGKFEQPWEVMSDLVFDKDVHPEGLNANYKKQWDNLGLVSNLGYFQWQDQQSANPASDVIMFVPQLVLKFNLGKNLKLSTGVSGFIYHNIKGTQTPNFESGKHMGSGNSMNVVVPNPVNPGDPAAEAYWIYDYEIAEGLIKLDIAPKSKFPLSLYGNYIQNLSKNVEGDTSWLAGTKLSYKKLSIDYNYRVNEADSHIGVTSFSGFAAGGTDNKGHKLSFKYKILKDWCFCLHYFRTEDTAKNRDINSFRMDMVVKF